MFRELMPLLKERTVMMTLSRVDDATIRVCVIPKRIKEDNKETTEESALCSPLAVTGTLDELDREFASQLSRYASSVVKLGSNFAEIEAAHEAATKSLKEEKKKDLDRQRGKGSTTKSSSNPPGNTQVPAMKDGKPVFGSKNGQAPVETRSLVDTAPSDTTASESPAATEETTEHEAEQAGDEDTTFTEESPIAQPSSVQAQGAFSYPD
jgi:PRTRC genetic system protein E